MNLRILCGLVLTAAVLLTGCPKASQETSAGAKAESLKDYDTALDDYNKARIEGFRHFRGSNVSQKCSY